MAREGSARPTVGRAWGRVRQSRRSPCGPRVRHVFINGGKVEEINGVKNVGLLTGVTGSCGNLAQAWNDGTIIQFPCSLQRGLVDFPSYRDGREIFLCWERDEDDIEFWHDLESGFSGRERL